MEKFSKSLIEESVRIEWANPEVGWCCEYLVMDVFLIAGEVWIKGETLDDEASTIQLFRLSEVRWFDFITEEKP